MTQPTRNPPLHDPLPHDLDAALRKRILERASAVNEKLMGKLSSIADALESGSHLEAIDTLRGLERKIYGMRSLLFLLS